MARYSNSPFSRIRQGDILRDIQYVEDAFLDEDGLLGISYIQFPFVVVLSQDCDLASDVRSRGKDPEENEAKVSTDAIVESILVCPAYERDLFIAGEHLSEIGLIKMQSWKVKSRDWEFIVGNRDQRYHFLSGSKELGTNDMVVDFKHFYTISRLRLYKDYPSHYVGTLGELYREQISQRFAYFLSRIGLPDE